MPRKHIHIADVVTGPPRELECTIPAPRRPVRPAPLTEFLKCTPEFIDGLLPNSRRAIALLNRHIGSRPYVGPCGSTSAGALHSRVAGAVDRGVLYLSGFDPAPRALERLRTPAGLRLLSLLRAYQPPRRRILRDRSAVGWFYLLGMLDPVMRGFRPLSDIDIASIPNAVTPQSASAWLAAQVFHDVAEEIACLLRIVRDVRPPGPIRPNPVLGGIGCVIGSDGDWIAGDTLVELKCTTRGVKREYVAQLLCYYVFDQMKAHGRPSPYGFTRLALCLPRQSCLVVGTVEEWLRAFGAARRSDVVLSVSEWLSRRR